MTFKELTYKNDKLRLKEGRVNKNYSIDKINCRRNPNAKEDLEPFILPFDVAWQIQDGVIALDSEFIIYKCSPKKVKQFIVDSSIPPSEFSVLDFDKVLETVKDTEITTILNDRNSYFTNSGQNKNIKLTKEERNIKYYEYWTNDCILVFSRNQDVYMTDIMSGFNYLYPDSLQRKKVFCKLSNISQQTYSLVIKKFILMDLKTILVNILNCLDCVQVKPLLELSIIQVNLLKVF